MVRDNDTGVIVEKPMTTYDVFEEHCKHVEDIFWKERFKIYDKWKTEITNFYRDNGYIETPFGFRLTSPMSKKECTNYPIQGTAFHCLLWSFIELTKIQNERGWKSRLIGQIHDSIIVDLYPPEQNEVIETMTYVMTEKLREEHEWIIVPMEVDFEITGINEPWSMKDDLDKK